MLSLGMGVVSAVSGCVRDPGEVCEVSDEGVYGFYWI